MYSYVKQISTFLPNFQGTLTGFTQLMADNGIDMLALSIADTTNFGIVRAIVPDYDRALSVLQQAGYTASITPVLAVGVPDSPGGLNRVLQILTKEEISIEYLYSFVHTVEEQVVLIIRVDDGDLAVEILQKAGIRLFDRSEIQ